ncbi:glycosyltransferase family 4 protein [Dyadobacter flavalbus]|uniref:Glycosyltransferase family 4 protein n=1 Tax=Dyadobacter flavalbus TaxID=2579942 RepID=A0A5M8Q6D3_9BACT|nr:glycosyltransferase family 4 protein [Dyadobacter flavalbus]KAA6431459.1 glycosyltransferase family 4 protein [Dyadobacter flavalbus]
MRILIIHNQLWAHYKSRLFSEIYSSLKKKYPESDFLVVQIALYEASRSAMQSDESIVYDYPYQVLFNRSLDSVHFPERLKSLFKAFHAYKPTVLNITGYFDWAQVLLMFYARIRGVKVVLSSESSSADHNRSALKERLKSFIVNRANAFFCFGRTSAQYLESLGVNPAAIMVRNAAVIDEDTVRTRYDLAKKQVGNENLIRKFIFTGRLAPEKNLSLLIRAFYNVQPINSGSWQLLLVGDGPERDLLENLTKSLNLSGKVTFAGGFPWYKVPEWLAKSDVLVLPSKSEPWGLVVNEAMTCGMPVLVSDKCGCAADLVEPGKNGFTFDPENQSALEENMRFFMQNPDRIVPMGKESVKMIVPFSSKRVASRMADCYKILSRRS